MGATAEREVVVDGLVSLETHAGYREKLRLMQGHPGRLAVVREHEAPGAE